MQSHFHLSEGLLLVVAVVVVVVVVGRTIY